MQKKSKKRTVTKTTSQNKKTTTSSSTIKKQTIKKKIPEKKLPKYNTKINTTKIKKRIEGKPTKAEQQVKMICLSLLLLVIVIIFVLFGIEFAAISLVGSALIIGFGLLLRKFKTTKFRRRLVNVLLILILTLGIIGIGAFGVFVLHVKEVADPQFEEKEKGLQTSETTILYDAEGNIFKKLGTERRTKVKYEDLPQVLVDAIIATEDSRFFQHNGFDAPRFIKAAFGQVLGNSDAGGASTLTMQVAKNTFSRDEDGEIASSGYDGVVRKFSDIYVSIFKLEKKYTKQEIIEFYVNNHFLGGNIYGVAEASESYFGKNVSQLNLSEAAIIAGMFKSPNYYRPTTNPENAAKRRDTVLYLMQKHGYITEEEAQAASSVPVESLIATSSVSTDIYQGFIDTVVDEIKTKYGVNPYTTSLLIYTTLERTRQNAVNSVFNGEAYNWVDDKVQSGVAVLETQTGRIMAIGNGRNIGNRTSTNLTQYNYATDIKRQPGSTAKPLFDYGPGIEYNNWSTYTIFDDAPYSYSSGQSIKNWDGGYYGQITLRTALSTSRNIPALKAFQQVNNQKIIEFVTNLGIEPEISNGSIHEAHSIGAFTGVSPLQMAAAYSAFSNGGYYNEPYSVNRIVFRATGEEKTHNSDNYIIKRRAMSEATAFMISSVLQSVSLIGGTPYGVAVKTGTTNYDYEFMKQKGLPDDAIRDSWAVGFSTKTAVAMWYGYDYVDPVYCLHNLPSSREKDNLFRTLVGAGAMEMERGAFPQPSTVVKVGVAQGSNPAKLATENTGNVIYEYFKKDYVPTEYDESPLSTPGNFSASYNKSTKKVTLSWNAVAPSRYAKDTYGKLGYNVYRNNEFLEWTDKTTYTFSTNDPYTTYRVIATYKAYSGIQSQPAITTLREQTQPVTPPSGGGSDNPPSGGGSTDTPPTDPTPTPPEENE